MKNNTAQKNIPQNWQEVNILDCFNIPAKVAGIKQSQYETSGEFPVFDQGQKYISGYSSNNELLIKNVPAILFGDHTRVVKYIENPFIAGADGTKIFWAKDNFNPAFLYYLVLNQKIPNTGYNRHFKFFKDIKVLLPDSKNEQQKIAEILGAMDEDIAKTQEVIKATEKLKKGLMQQLFTRGIGHTKFKKTKLGEIPDEWSVVLLENVAHVIDSLHKTPKFIDDGLPMVRVSDIREGFLKLKNTLKVSKEDYSEFTAGYTPKNGDIVLSRVGSYGISAYANSDEKFCMGQNTVVIDCVKINSIFLYYLLNSHIIKEQIENEVAGSGYKSLSLKSIRNLQIVIPNDKEQQEVAEIMSAVDEKILINKKLKAKLTLLKKGLMQDLLSGIVRTV